MDADGAPLGTGTIKHPRRRINSVGLLLREQRDLRRRAQRYISTR